MDKISIDENKFLNIDNAITPWGDINFPPVPISQNRMPDSQYHHYYMDDFTLRSKGGKIPANLSLLVHEVTHAWQYQYAGIIFSVIALECQALKFAYNPCNYSLSEKMKPRQQVLRSLKIEGKLPDALFMDVTPYNPEALASIVEDYYYRFLRHDKNGNKLPDMGTRFTHNKQGNANKNINDYIMVLSGYVMA